MNNDGPVTNPIDRMALSGVLTPEQAAELRQASNPAAVARASLHRPLPFGLIAALALGAGLLGLVLLTGQDGAAITTIQDVSQTINTSEGVGAMSKSVTGAISFIIFALPVIIGLLYFVSVYNGIVKNEEAVYSAWADVESTYKRRADLVPNLVSAVQTYMQHERTTLTEVTDKRNDLGKALKTLSEQQAAAMTTLQAAGPDNEQALNALDRSQSMLAASLRGVMATVEAYPTLRAADQFMTLQAELEGTENRINVARQRFNDEVRAFNSSIRKMPGSLAASLGGFKRKAYFTTTAEDKQPVHVQFQAQP